MIENPHRHFNTELLQITFITLKFALRKSVWDVTLVSIGY